MASSSTPEPSSARQGPAGTRPLLVIFFTVFLDLLGFGIVIPVLPFYAEQHGASALQVTALGASYSLMQFLFAPLWGRLSDQRGRRPIILVGVAMSAVGYTLFGLADSLVMLFAARMVAGVGNANIPTAQAYIADVTTPENRARGMGLIGMSFGLGFILGPALGWGAASLGDHLSGGRPDALFNHASTPAFLAAGLAVLDVVMAYFLLPESLKPGAVAPARRALLSPAALVAAVRQPVVGTLLLVNFVFVLGWSNVEGTWGLLLERMFVPNPGTHEAAARAIQLTGASLTFIGVVSAVVQGGLIGRLTARLGERALLITGLFMQALALAVVSFMPTFWAAMPAMFLMALSNGLINPSTSSLISRSAAATEQGITLGAGQSLSALARAVGPVWGGLLFQEINHHAPYVASALTLLLAAVLALRVPNPRAHASAGT